MKQSNIINIDNNKNIKFITTSAWIDYVYLKNVKVEKKHFAIISLKNIVKDTHVIHPLSQFIIDNWKNKQYNTQRKHSNNIVQFLNYLVRHRKQLKLLTLAELQLSHGTQYLNDLSISGVSRDTVKDAERTLTRFYQWLNKINIIDFSNQMNFEKKESQFGSYIESPFKPIYPARRVKEIEHTLPVEYLPLLLEVAISVAKPIALGIYFQIFGGLRISEVMNLRRLQVARRMREGDFILKLQNQNFRTDLKEHSSVKKERSQRVLEVNDWGNSLFRDHIKIYKPQDETNALFINRDGKAMSQRSYRQYFQKVKEHFIRLLETYGDSEQKLIAQHLRYMKWSTHIGRGTFTNIIAENAENPYEIAHLRGDSNIDSSLTYMVSTERIHKKIEEKFSNMHEKYIPNLIIKKE